MKNKIVLSLLLLMFAAGRGMAQMAFLDTGEKVDKYPKVEWIKGTPFSTFDPSKIYVIDLWATWCKPCIAAMPHLNELSRRFKDKIVFVAQDVMENDQAKVTEFVTRQGDNMDMNVAFGGPRGGDFDKKWIVASDTRSIPRTFVIQNNTLVLITTPNELNPRVLQSLLDNKQSGWQHKDLHQDSVFGISTGKAYDLLKGKKSNPVIVAVIDDGTDTAHEDLRSVLWVNAKEIKGNKKDDDKNHYPDDVNGWSFLGSGKGNVHYDNLELTRLVRQGKQRFGSLSTLSADTSGLARFNTLELKYNNQLNTAKRIFARESVFKNTVDTISMRTGKKDPALEDIAAYEPQTETEAQIKGIIMVSLKEGKDFEEFKKETAEQYDRAAQQVDYALNLSFDPRELVGDDYANVKESYYGTPDVTGPDAEHGTHVAGIIGAVRNNGIGIDGVADNVRLMIVRAVPIGDERDKDIANAIRYAVDNGAKVINMSFGKPFSPYKPVVDEAVRYAMSKDVLLVHAAGNDAVNLDLRDNFPNKRYAGGNGSAEAWIEVGASGAKDDVTLAASFSNYGSTTVDVFAPGIRIYSTLPGSKYGPLDGTSMAAPVVAGIAALIREYFPKLSAVQVKEIIMRSVVKVDHQIRIGSRLVDFTSLCVSGGIVNAYEAVKLAQQVDAAPGH